MTKRKHKQSNLLESKIAHCRTMMRFDPNGDSLQVTRFHGILLFALMISTSCPNLLHVDFWLSLYSRKFCVVCSTLSKRVNVEFARAVGWSQYQTLGKKFQEKFYLSKTSKLWSTILCLLELSNPHPDLKNLMN